MAGTYLRSHGGRRHNHHHHHQQLIPSSPEKEEDLQGQGTTGAQNARFRRAGAFFNGESKNLPRYFSMKLGKKCIGTCIRRSEHCTQIFVSCCSGKSFSRFRSLTSCEGEFPCERDDKMYSSLNFEREFSSVVFVLWLLWLGLCILF